MCTVLALVLSTLPTPKHTSEPIEEPPVWLYVQSTGNLYQLSSEKAKRPASPIATGYSGHGEGLNNPAKEKVTDVGPIPAGKWTIGKKFDHPSKGPVVMKLSPSGHNAFDRTNFLIHGDNQSMNNTASNGCIILSRTAREKIADSGAVTMVVVKE